VDKQVPTFKATAEIEANEAIGPYRGWVRYHGNWRDGPFSHVVFDWSRGQMLERVKRPGTAASVRIVRQLLAHVGELHRRGYLHLDLKPGNVMIDQKARPRSVILVDLGEARRVDAGVLEGSSGTAEYRAPEQRGGHALAPSADVFATAGILVYLLTGEHPNPRAHKLSQSELEARYRERPALARIENRGLRRVLRKALDPDPARRYQSAAAFRRALRPYVDP